MIILFYAFLIHQIFHYYKSTCFLFDLFYIFQERLSLINFPLQLIFYKIGTLRNMEWINRYSQRAKPAKSGSLLAAFHNLAIDQDHEISQTDGTKLKSFKEFSFTSSLQRTFKDNCFTYEQPQEYNAETGIFLEFSIQLPTQYEQLTVVVDVEINLKLQYIRYRSYILQNNQIFAYTRDQINAISRYLSTNVNPRNALGCMSIDNETGQIIYQTVNNSLCDLARRIKKASDQLTREIEKTWMRFLPNFLNVMNIPAVKNKKHSFWQKIKQKKSVYDSQEFLILMEYVKQSYIEHPFMFDEEQEEKGKKVVKKIRSKLLNPEQKNKKKAEYERMIAYKQRSSAKFKREILNLLKLFVSPSLLNHQIQSYIYQISEDKKILLSNHLLVNKSQSRHFLYSPLEIREIKYEKHLSKSGFSNLKILNVVAKKAEEKEYALTSIVSKETQQKRFINQTQILTIMGKGKSMFISRFYFSSPGDLAGNGSGDLKNKILLEYCPQNSIDNYLISQKNIVSLDTKVYFLYQIAGGIRFLRDYRIIHNDLKPSNLLLKILSDKQKMNSTFVIKIIDFGQSYSNLQTPMMRQNHQRGYTMPYASPQQVMKDHYDEKNDIFSFGVILYEIIFDYFPVEIYRKGRKMYISKQNYVKFYSIAPEKCKYFGMPKLVEILYQICLRCIDPEPINRPVIDWIVAILQSFLLFVSKLSVYDHATHQLP